MRVRLWLTVVALAAAAGAGVAAPPCADADHTHERAGYPLCISKWAVVGRTDKYAVGYVGGGCLGVCKGEPRRCDEGTFGWDYVGCHCWRPSRVFLQWCHCAK